MYLIVKAENASQAAGYIEQHLPTTPSYYEGSIGPNEHKFSVESTNALVAAKWFNETPTSAPYPNGTLLHFTIQRPE